MLNTYLKGAWGDEEAVTDDAGGRNKKSKWKTVMRNSDE